MPLQIPTMPAPSADALERLREWIGSDLPSSYLDFVAAHDGAEPAPNSLNTVDNEVGVRRFIPVGEAPTLAERIDGFPVHVIPIAEDDCGNYFYVEPKTGAVYFWDHEVEGRDEKVAENAAGFVERLEQFDANRAQVAPGQVISSWIDPDFLASLKRDGAT